MTETEAMPDKLGLLILAGGAGQRMGGANKALVNFRGKPLIEHVLNHLAERADAVVISANRDMQALQAYGYPVIADAEREHLQGPLAGIVSAATLLEQAGCTRLQIVPCDMPYLSRQVVDVLQDALLADEHLDVVYARAGGRDYPIVCQMRTRHLPRVAAELRSDGKHSMRAVIEPFAHRAVECDAVQFANCNNMTILQQHEQSGTTI